MTVDIERAVSNNAANANTSILNAVYGRYCCSDLMLSLVVQSTQLPMAMGLVSPA